MAEYKIYNWQDISDDFSECLLLGNGASIAVDDRFSYGSLLEEADKLGLITDGLRDLFEHFQTEDFEFILRMLWNTYHVNAALDIEDERSLQVYEDTKRALIEVVKEVHVEKSEIMDIISRGGPFLRSFETIFSLNYDLIVYWTFLDAQEEDPSVEFKDCFVVLLRKVWISNIIICHGGRFLGDACLIFSAK